MLRGLVGCVVAVKRYPSLKFHMKLSVCHVLLLFIFNSLTFLFIYLLTNR